MKYYKAKSTTFGTPIVSVEIERVTESSVFINGRRRAKFSDYESYFETFEYAKKWLMERAERKIQSASYQLSLANEEYKKYSELNEF